MTTIRGTRPPPDSSATAQTTVVDCAYATCKSGKVVEFGMRDWRHEWNVKESVGADVLGGPQPQSNANRVVGRLRAAEDVRPYRGRVSRVFGAKT